MYQPQFEFAESNSDARPRFISLGPCEFVLTNLVSESESRIRQKLTWQKIKVLNIILFKYFIEHVGFEYIVYNFFFLEI